MKEETKKVIKECLWCKEKFEVKRKWQSFCSAKCRWHEWDKSHPRIK